MASTLTNFGLKIYDGLAVTNFTLIRAYLPLRRACWHDWNRYVVYLILKSYEKNMTISIKNMPSKMGMHYCEDRVEITEIGILYA